MYVLQNFYKSSWTITSFAEIESISEKLFGWKLQRFSNSAFQSCYDLFQVNWLVQT